MQIRLEYRNLFYKTDLSHALDISIAVEAGEGHVRAWYLGPARIEPVRMGDWVGEVRSGAAVNFRDVYFNPHGHGTHTETLGHISAEDVSVRRHFRDFFCFAHVVSVLPLRVEADALITLEALRRACPQPAEALVLRTLPNSTGKQTQNYSNTNPAYLAEEAALWLREQGVKHLLIDTPSVDREEDGGKLLAHHAFWNYPQAPRTGATITELVFVPDEISDGLYFMNLQVAAFENDAAPSRPLLFALEED
ncbi:MAG: cyclase family protein [Bacteroidia bacterium]|nr:cyclase family protein [Bacteroidia bacterium]